MINYPPITPLPTSENRPFWSVMIPTYNPSEFLIETLESILQQNIPPEQIQIEVIDDSSPQNTAAEIVENIGKGRVKFYRQPQNLGISGNWNACLHRAQGHWVHILHQDDLLLPKFYQNFYQTIQENPTIEIAFCRNIYIDEQGNWQYFSDLEQNHPGFLTSLNNWQEKIMVSCAMMCPAVVVKRTVYEQLGGFHPGLKYALDWDMWKRISVNFPIWYEPTPYACYRLHSDSTSNRLINTGQNLIELYKSIEITEQLFPELFTEELIEKAKHYQASFGFHLAKGLLAKGDTQAAFNQIKQALTGCFSIHTLRQLSQLLTLPEATPLLALVGTLFIEEEAANLFAESSLLDDFTLKEINLIIFPDWNQTEENLRIELTPIFQTITAHPQPDKIALFITTNNLEQAELMIAGILMDLLMANPEEIAEPTIQLLEPNFSPQQWQALLPYLHSRIPLETENNTFVQQFPQLAITELSTLTNFNYFET